MATRTINCPIIGQCLITKNQTSLNYSENSEFTLKYHWEEPYIVAIKFYIPEFSGTSPALEVNLGGTKADFNVQDYSICYALCVSDSNYANYVLNSSAVNDSFQIERGTLSREEWTSMPFRTKIQNLTDGYYYLIFWIPSDNGFVVSASAGSASSHKINLIYSTTDDEYTLHINQGNGTEVSVERIDSSQEDVDYSYKNGDYRVFLSDGDAIWYEDVFSITASALPGYKIDQYYDIEDQLIPFSASPELTNMYIFGDESPYGYKLNSRSDLYITTTATVDETVRYFYKAYIDNGTSWVPL